MLGQLERGASLEQTVYTITRLTGTVKQNAEHARSARQLAMAARGQGEQGRGFAVVASDVRKLAQVAAAFRLDEQG
jgi:methyl-accepting chemotaxis protein